MRLIDADETLRLMEFEEYKYQYEEHYGYRQAEKFIELQPTIDAIPLEWIIEWLEKNNTHYCTVDLMLEAWEKENEQEN